MLEDTRINSFSSEDHDLLVTLKVRMEDIKNDIKEIKDGTTKRIEDLERGKTDKSDFELLQKKVNKDIEDRVRALEGTKDTQKIYLGLILFIGLLIVGLLIWHLTGYKI